MPSSGMGSPFSSNSRGFGGRRPPSYQWRATGGIPARSGNSQRMSEAWGYDTVLTCFFHRRSSIFQYWLRLASTVSGAPSSRILKIWKKE
jgi:hypothetical protein